MDVSSVRNDFPTIRDNKGVYLDNACQTLRPDAVIDGIVRYYSECPACAGRSVHSMSSEVSVKVDETREHLARFFGTDDPDCFVFTRNTTEALNTVAFGSHLKKGDVVVSSDSEHNSDHVPFVVLKDKVGIVRRFSLSRDDGEFDLDCFTEQMCRDVKLVAIQHCSNVTGCVTPLKDIVELAHDCGALVVADGAQAAPHFRVDLKKLDVDFYALSMHKMLGPSGMGILYGKRECLEELDPLHYGGGAVGSTSLTGYNLAPIPDRFEAGLQDYAGMFGTDAALSYIEKIGWEDIQKHEKSLMRKIFSDLEDVKGLHIVGPETPGRRCGVFSFNIDGLVSHDIALMLDNMDNIMIRSGMHCAHPLNEKLKISGSARASTYVYNDDTDIERFTTAVKKVAEQFGR